MFSKQEIDRLIALHDQIESRKEHQYAAPTYKDRAALMEMEQILFSNSEGSADVLDEKISVLMYLAACYDEMCRTGISLKFHNKLIETHAELSLQKDYEGEDMDFLRRISTMQSRLATFIMPMTAKILSRRLTGYCLRQRSMSLLALP